MYGPANDLVPNVVGFVARSRHLQRLPSLHQAHLVLPIFPNHSRHKLASPEDNLHLYYVDHSRLANWSGLRPGLCVYPGRSLMGPNHRRQLSDHQQDACYEQHSEHRDGLYHPLDATARRMASQATKDPEIGIDRCLLSWFRVSNLRVLPRV